MNTLEWIYDGDVPAEHLLTSTLLETWMANMRRGPQEEGYTDKAFWRRQAELAAEIDRRIPKT